MAANLFPRYIWLAETIYNAGRITKFEIDRAWLNSPLNTDGDEEYEIRSFHRHKEAIAELFGLNIACDRTTGHEYYIENADKISDTSFSRWLTNHFAIINLTAETQDLQGRVCFDDEEDNRKGLRRVIDAMHCNEVLHIAINDEEYQVEPYGLRQHNGHWYLIAPLHDTDEQPQLWDLQEVSFIRDIHPLHFHMPKRFRQDRFFEENPLPGKKKAAGKKPVAPKATPLPEKKAEEKQLSLFDF